MDRVGGIHYKSKIDDVKAKRKWSKEGQMQFVIEAIRKVVVLVLLMEIVLQIQAGKQYEPYIKMLVGVMVVYSLVSGVIRQTDSGIWASLQEFQWSESWYSEFGKEAEALAEAAMEKEKLQEVDGGETGHSIGKIDVRVEISPVAEVSVGKIAGVHP